MQACEVWDPLPRAVRAFLHALAAVVIHAEYFRLTPLSPLNTALPFHRDDWPAPSPSPLAADKTQMSLRSKPV